LHDYDAWCQGLLEQLDATPGQVVYEHESTRNSVRRQLDQIKATCEFLTKARASDRVIQRGYFRDKAAVAREVLGNRPAAADGQCKEAITVLRGQHAELKQKLAALNAAREAIVARARTVLQCLKELRRQGLLTDGPIVANLEETLSLVFWKRGPAHKPGVRRREAPVAAALKEISLRDFLQQAMEAVGKHLAAEIPRAIEDEKRAVLIETAKTLAARLATVKAPSEFSCLERTILALHFTFTSARSGLGAIGNELRAQHEKSLANAPSKDAQIAVNSLIRRNVLRLDNFEVFRYTAPVWKAVEQFRNSGMLAVGCE
jgi:hypothetical protein